MFPVDAKMTLVYYWIRSLAEVPEHFSMCLSPGICIQSVISVMTVKTVLFMETFQEVVKNGT